VTAAGNENCISPFGAVRDAMKIFKGIRKSWRVLRSGKPGERFERYYRSEQEGRTPLRKFISIFVGVTIFAAGLVFLPAPGPGTLVVALGLGLLAREFRFVARALDGLEPRLRRAAAGAARFWKSSPPLGRAALVLIVIVLAGGAAFGGYELLFAD
jgi:hypothetical protein